MVPADVFVAFYGFLLPDEGSDCISGLATSLISSRGTEEDNNREFAPYLFLNYVISTKIFRSQNIVISSRTMRKATVLSVFEKELLPLKWLRN